MHTNSQQEPFVVRVKHYRAWSPDTCQQTHNRNAIQSFNLLKHTDVLLRLTLSHSCNQIGSVLCVSECACKGAVGWVNGTKCTTQCHPTKQHIINPPRITQFAHSSHIIYYHGGVILFQHKQTYSHSNVPTTRDILAAMYKNEKGWKTKLTTPNKIKIYFNCYIT